MEFALYVIILTIFCQNVNSAQPNLENNKVIFDLTRQVSDFINRKISKHDFRANFDSALIGANIRKPIIFYATDGRTFKESEEQTQTFCKAIKKLLKTVAVSQMLVSWKINLTATQEAGLDTPYNIAFAGGCTPNLLLYYHDETKCDEKTSSSFYKMINLAIGKFGRQRFVGVGYDESVMDCESYQFSRLHLKNLYGNDFGRTVLLSHRFGNTDGVTESFGLFQTRMHFLVEKIKDVHQQNHLQVDQILYYPNPKSVVDNKHQHLLINFASIWATSGKANGSMLLQVPNSRKDSQTSTQFSIIPLLKGSLQPIDWPLSVFTSSFQRKQSAIIQKSIWRDWITQLRENYTSTLKTSKLPLLMDVAVDCAMFYCRYPNSFESRPDLSGSKPTVSFEPREYEKIIQFAQKYNIMCYYWYGTFTSTDESDVKDAVQGCQRINGSGYILRSKLWLAWSGELYKYSFTFEDKVRKELHALNRFRKWILEKEPNAMVYYKPDITETHRPPLLQNLWARSSLFCEEMKPAVNMYLEAIFNWAVLESFPIIIEIETEGLINSFGNWISFMRRLNYPYSETSANSHRNIGLINLTSPSFLIQDYLKSIHSWKVDTCIDWTEKREEIPNDFFHHESLGTVFRIFKNQKLGDEDCNILLQFLFYRFRFLELCISFDFENLLRALEQIFASESFDLTTKTFVNYEMLSMNSEMYFSKFQSFIAQLTKSRGYELGLIKGVHVDFVGDLRYLPKNVVIGTSNIKPVSRMMKYAKLSNVTCGISMDTVKICNEMLKQFNYSDSDVYSEIFSTVDYIICKEHIKTSESLYIKSNLQSMLDYHLVIKRIMKQLAPNLQLYFRVEFDFDIAKNNATLDRYTSFLTLFKSFGTAYDISYFIGNAFDNHLDSSKTGWWGIKNYSDLTNPQSYIEKVTVFRGQIMWYPSSKQPLPNGQDSTPVIIGLSVSSVGLLIFFIAGICIGIRYKKRQVKQFPSDSEVEEFLDGSASANNLRGTTHRYLMDSVEQMKFPQTFKLDSADLTIDIEKVLGSRAFGTVFKGLARDTVVAIKRPNRHCSKITFKSFLTETKVLAYIGNHPNVVGFLGAYVTEINKNILYIATEFCAIGSLESFLRRKANEISGEQPNQNNEKGVQDPGCYQLCAFAKEIAQGMQYIESKRVIHGDLATRNVLLDANMVCKIGDFGLSRKLYTYEKYVKKSQEPLPWKWMAPESLDKMEFTSKSDVWSYGVTLWEIYSLGRIPYAGLNWNVDFTKELRNGLRLTTPEFASEIIFAKMEDCWNLTPKERPSFSDMIGVFQNLSEDPYAILDSIKQEPQSTD